MTTTTSATDVDPYAAFVRRILRALGRRIADRDIASLHLLITVADELDAQVVATVGSLKECGYSWADIGRELGVSREAAYQRFAPKISAAANDRRIPVPGTSSTLSQTSSDLS